MNWEVSSMQSKRSFFNVTLFKKNLSRSWPLWGGITALGCLMPLYMLLALLQQGSYARQIIDAQDFRMMLYTVAAYFVPAAAFGYAILVAMVVWSYLYNARSVGMMHTLPIDRTGLFVTNALSGLTMLLIPYAAVGALVCLLALAFGFMDLLAVAATVVAVLLMTVLFFGMATLCAMATGNVFALPAFYLIVNFLAPALDWLFSTLSSSFLLGVSGYYTGAVEVLSPLVKIYQTFSVAETQIGERVWEYRLEGFGTVALYGLVGLVLLGAALVLYLRRRSESAGDVVAFQWLRPVFRCGIALCSALSLGHLLYALIWESLFQRGEYADAVPMALCMAVTGLVGYYGASMLLEKSLRVFRGSAVRAAAVAAACAAICLAASADLTGMESYVPDLADVDTIYIYASDVVGNSPTLSAKDDPQLVEQVLALHRAIVDNKEEIKASEGRGYAAIAGENVNFDYQWLRLEYRLTDDSTVQRGYSLYLKESAWQENTGYEGAFKAVFTSSDFQQRQVLGNGQGEINTMEVYNYSSGVRSEGPDTEPVYQALLADAQAGRLYDYDPFDDYYNNSYPVEVDIEYRTSRDPEGLNGNFGSDGLYTYQYISVSVRPTMTATIQALLDQEIVTLEELQEWDEENGYQTDYSAYQTMPVSIGG